MGLLTISTSRTLVEFASEALLNQVVQTVFQRFELHAVDHLIDEGKLQQQLGFLLTDAALAHVEHSLVVELTHGRTMTTFHIIGINLQLWLGVHARLLRGAEILVAHLRVGLLRSLLYKHPTGKGSRGLTIENVLV